MNAHEGKAAQLALLPALYCPGTYMKRHLGKARLSQAVLSCENAIHI